MPSLPIVALLAVLAMTASPTMAGAEGEPGNRLLPLTATAKGSCTRDGRLCVSLTEPDEAGTVRPVVGAAGPPTAAARAPEDDSASAETHAVWPALVTLEGGGFLAGVETRTRTSYSGGGGSGTDLRLFRIAPDGTAAAGPVLEVPVGGSLLIRACFGERDLRRRRGACHDEYGFSARIAVAPGTAAGHPVLTYASEAWGFPRGASRSGDSNRMPPLRKEDLVRQRDAACSVTRRFRFDAAAGAYRPDRPLPECSDYTVP